MESDTAQDVASTTDWAREARSAVAKTDTAGYRKLGRGRLARLCTILADGIPLETAAPLVGTRPATVREWCEKNPAVDEVVTRSRATGEALYLKRIALANDWKASQFMLGAVNERYRENSGAAHSGGPAIQVVINVPTPQLVAAGERPVIDVIPQRTAQDVAPLPVEPAK